MPLPFTQTQNAELRVSQIAQYAAEIDAVYPPSPDSAGVIVDLGQDYVNYMNKHPNADPYITYETVMARAALLLSVPVGIAKALAGGLGTVSAVGKAGAQSTSSLYPAWLQGFLGANGVLRIAEGILGIVLVAVAADKLLGSNAPVIATKIARVVK
jgi:hypothetical protein